MGLFGVCKRFLTLTFKQTSIFRTSIKQSLIESGLEVLKIDYIDDTKQGTSFVKSYVNL